LAALAERPLSGQKNGPRATEHRVSRLAVGTGDRNEAYLVLDFSIHDLPGFQPCISAIPAFIDKHGEQDRSTCHRNFLVPAIS
jgi:hypothetical protein